MEPKRMERGRRRWLMGLLLLPMLGGAGCVAAGAAAGAAGAIAYTDRGAKGEVQGNVDEVSKNAEKVMSQMEIQRTELNQKSAGAETELKGKSVKEQVTINIKSTGPKTSHVEVVAQENTVKWNKDDAKAILTRIVEQTG